MPSQPFAGPLPDGWVHIDAVDLAAEYRCRAPTMDHAPFVIRADYARIQAATLLTLRTAYDVGDGHAVSRGWKLFSLLAKKFGLLKISDG